jgi:predicted lactoylglutathione lyase
MASTQGVAPRVSLITIAVLDPTAMTAFYERIGFGLSGASVPGEVSFFHTGGAILALWGRADLARDAAVDESVFGVVCMAINVGSPVEVDEALAVAQQAGATIPRGAEATEWGGYNGYFADPEGNLWEVAHNPFWPLDERNLPQLPQ